MFWKMYTKKNNKSDKSNPVIGNDKLCETKICIHCGKSIKTIAKKCRYCKKFLIEVNDINNETTNTGSEDEEINCPYCSERIKKNAQKCKHCNEWLNKKTPKHKSVVILLLISSVIILAAILLLRSYTIQGDSGYEGPPYEVSSSVPDCSDQSTVYKVLETVKESNYYNSELIPESIASAYLKNTRATDYNENIQKYTCSGDIVLESSNQGFLLRDLTGHPFIYKKEGSIPHTYICSVYYDSQFIDGNLQGIAVYSPYNCHFEN